MRVAITQIGGIFTGELAEPWREAEGLLLEEGHIAAIGPLDAAALESCDVVVEAAGAIAAPGLIDSHVHITFGDYTPRQRSVGFLESYVHGGVTTAISASEVHVPGRPRDPAGVIALAMAAEACFRNYRPGGMRVVAGSVILEPGLVAEDFTRLHAAGVRLAKAGFGGFASPFDYAAPMGWARATGLITTMHTGGASIPGSSGIWAEHVLSADPHVSFHVNGGPVAMPEPGFARLVREGRMALQICTAGNLRTALLTARLLAEAGQLDRLLVATDTPTGSGIMPLGMLYTITHLASLGGMAPEAAFACATGNNARVYGLDSGVLAPGRAGDVLLLDAAEGGGIDNARAAIANGDIPAVAAVFTAGEPRFVGRSRNTPAPRHPVRVAQCRLPRELSAVGD
jgi:enamidase